MHLCALCNELYNNFCSAEPGPVLKEMSPNDLQSYSLTCSGICGCLYLGIRAIVPLIAQQQTQVMVFGGGRASNSNFRVQGTQADYERTTFKLELSTECDYADWPGAMFRTSPGLPSNSESTESLAQLTQWFHDCVNDHEDCRIALQLPPTTMRVVNAQNGKLRLVEGFDINKRYAALSHCWGSGKHVKTTKGSLSSHLQGIALDTLPRTFRDALRICNLLQIEYLWIDSLCVVQDDPVDWENEASKMREIYRHAEIVLAATAARDSSDGLFTTRSPSVELTWTSNNPAQTTITLFVREAVEHTQYTVLYTEIDEREQLMTRAWCLQEWLLARRVIHFSRSELVWDCFQEIRCECQTLDAQHKTRLPIDGSGPGLRDQLKQVSKSLPMDGFDTIKIIRVWTSLVEEYTARNITRYSDRMIAISGLAGEMNRIPGTGPYRAGLLSLDFERQLLWSRKDATKPKSRPSDPVAPSWSWGSILEPVEWQVLWQAMSEDSLSIDECEVVEVAQIVVIGGGISQAQQTDGLHIRMRTSFMRGYIKAGQEFDFGQCIAVVDDTSSGGRHEIFFTLDVDISFRLDIDLQVVFLRLITFEVNVNSIENDLCGSLVLGRLNSTNDHYERIGIVLGDIPASLYCSTQVGDFSVA